mgnify:FL=1
MQHEELTKIIIGCAYTVHNTNGQQHDYSWTKSNRYLTSDTRNTIGKLPQCYTNRYRIAYQFWAFGKS